MKIEFYDKETGEAVNEYDQTSYKVYGDGTVHAWSDEEYEEVEYKNIGFIIDQWQPIETAPKDGTGLLLSDGCLLDFGYFCEDTNMFATERPFFVPTHWMPLPPNPQGSESNPQS